MELDTKQKKMKTNGRFYLMCALCFGDITYCLSNACITPFYPSVAEQKGVSSTVVGIILAALFLPQLFLSPFADRLILKLGPRTFYFLSLSLNTVALILFSFTDKIDDTALFISACFIARFVQGIGYSFLWISVAFLTTEYMPERLTFLLGVLESTGGLAYSIGPPFGGFVFEQIGYIYPTLICAGLCLIALVFAIKPLADLPPISKERSKSVSGNKATTLKIMLYSNMALIFIITLLPFILLPFLDILFTMYSTLTLDIAVSTVGFVLLGTGIFYSVISVILAGFINKKGFHFEVIFFGLVLLVILFSVFTLISLMFEFIPFAALALIVVLGNTILSMAYIPSYALMKTFAISNNFPDTEELSASLSNVLTTIINLGQLTGNLLSGIIYQYVGTFISSIVITLISVTLALLWVCTTYKHSKKKAEEKKMLLPKR